MIRTKKTEKIFWIITAFIFMLTNLGLLAILPSKKLDSTFGAGVPQNYVNEMTLGNSSFTNTNTSSYPKTPSNWTKKGMTKDFIYSGVVDLSDNGQNENRDDYHFDYKMEQSQSTDAYALMINAEDKANVGYASEGISLEANSFYNIKISVATRTASGGASMYLINDEDEVMTPSFDNITPFDWSDYTFRIATGETAETVKLELWLGSREGTFKGEGQVFFDNIKVNELSENIFIDNMAFAPTNVKTVDLRILTESSLDLIQNTGFEEEINDSWTRIEVEDSVANQNALAGRAVISAGNIDSTATGITEVPGTNLGKTFYAEASEYVANNNALFINTVEDAKAGFESKAFTIARNETIKISFYVKTGEFASSTGASAKLIEVVGEDEEVTFSSEFTNINTSAFTNAKTNDWALHTFHVQGNPFKDIDLKLQFWVGSETATARGYALFDEIRVVKINYETFNGAENGDYVKLFKVSNLTDPTIKNGAFNIVNGALDNGIYTPSDWTFVNGNDEENVQSGIVNTKIGLIDWQTLGVNNPGLTPIYSPSSTVDAISNNVLMVNNVDTYQYFESVDLSLDANTLYCISVYAKANIGTDYAFVKLMDEGNVVGEFSNVKQNSWQKYSFYVNTGTASKTLKLQLGLGKANYDVSGFAFYDDADMSKIAEGSLSDYARSEVVQTIDYANISFDTHGEFAVNQIYKATMWTASDTSGAVDYGILNTENGNPYGVDIDAEEGKENVLVISSTTDTSFTLTSKVVSSFTANTYYRVDVRLKTFGIEQEEHNKQLDDDDNVIPFGVALSITNLEGTLKGINTAGKTNEWQTYSIYLAVGNSTLSGAIKISLGTSDALTKGIVVVDDIAVTSLLETAYNEGIADKDAMNKTFINIDNTAEIEDEEEEKAPRQPIDFTMIDLAGLIIVLALVIAIVGTIIKRARANRKARVVVTSSAEYARKGEKKVEVVKDKDNSAVLERINELKAEIKRVEEYLGELEAEGARLNEELSTAENKQKIERKMLKIKEEMEYNRDNLKAVNEELTAQLDKLNKK